MLLAPSPPPPNSYHRTIHTSDTLCLLIPFRWNVDSEANRKWNWRRRTRKWKGRHNYEVTVWVFHNYHLFKTERVISGNRIFIFQYFVCLFVCLFVVINFFFHLKSLQTKQVISPGEENPTVPCFCCCCCFFNGGGLGSSFCRCYADNQQRGCNSFVTWSKLEVFHSLYLFTFPLSCSFSGNSFQQRKKWTDWNRNYAGEIYSGTCEPVFFL